MKKYYIRLTLRQFVGLFIVSLGLSMAFYLQSRNQVLAVGLFGNALAGLMVIWGKK